MRLCESVIPCDCDTAEIPPDHATVMMFEYYPELPVPIRELLLNFACHVREMPPEMRRQPNTAFARITTRLWLLPNSVDRKIKYFACTACAVQRCPDCEYPTRFPFQLLYPFEGHSERYHPSENSVVDDRLFHLWKEKIGRPRVDITDTG